METPPIETPPMETSSIIDGTSSASPGVSSSIKKKITKTDDDKIPLPDPFPLPKRYRPEVEKALKAKQMSNKTRSDFLSSVASAILSFKMYPTREDYNCVARSIVKEYPFLKAPPGAGSPHVRNGMYIISNFLSQIGCHCYSANESIQRVQKR